ncbi:amino acid adenylation domain-containing protein [Kitasatospora sp. NPDC101155]|uniref:non-ribosomal peptide synthetase n=1 Tax=Kitasatospora sp. NPDC101155 TaxID=3364097 RepID=UPI00381D6607
MKSHKRTTTWLRQDTGTRFSRAVAPLEHWYLGFPRGLSPGLNLVVEGIGGITEEVLRRAVAAASEACPGARLTRRGGRWLDSGQAPPVRLVAGRTPDRDTLDRAAELSRPLPARGAYCEAVLFDGPRPAVAFRASHAVMDARGLRHWAADVFRALRGEEPLGARSTITVTGLDEPLLHQGGGVDGEFALRPVLDVPRGAGLHGQRWWRRTVDGTYPAVAARLATELARRSGEPVATVGIPVDLRQFHPGLDSTGNLAVTVSLDITAGQEWEETQRQLLGVLAERRGTVRTPGPEILRAPLGLLRMIVRRLDRGTRGSGRFSSVASVTSLGRIDPVAFATADFRPTSVYLLCPREPASPPGLSVVECDGRTELTLSWWSGAECEAQAEELLDGLCEALSPSEARAYATLPPEPSSGSSDARTVVERFRAQVAARPDAVAISGPDGDVTYAELDRRARAVAAGLRERGLGRDTVVGLLTDRSAAAVAGAWGALMAGTAYLPMDPGHPDARVRELLADAGAPLCMTHRPYAQRDFLPPGCTRLLLDELPDGPTPDLPPGGPEPADLAYVVYTSGSTGKPKGVEIEHGALAGYASWAIREHGIDHDTRLPLLCSLSFDVAEISLILPFLAGGTLLVMGEELTHVSLREVLAAGATALALTPTHLDLITRLDLEPGRVRTLLVIGEQFTRALALRARERFGPDCRIVNLYGPAEATIGVSQHVFDDARDDGASVPIGRPGDGVTMYLLDADRRFAAPGATGELYLGGCQLARGYRGRADLTRERFVHLADGTRVYRTGDLARRLPSGEMELLGRIDDQVKVNGHRIEPAEIARTLEEHPDVAAAVVVARSRPGRSGKVLCGYVLPRPDVRPPDAAELERHLLARVPAYLVPAALTLVDRIPRTVNGKVAVDALPDPFGEPGATAPPEAVALSPVEREVARIWARVLGVETGGLGPDSDFHELGGDSPAMITMVAEVAREVAGPDGEARLAARLREVVARPTLARVAALAEAARPERIGPEVSQIP